MKLAILSLVFAIFYMGEAEAKTLKQSESHSKTAYKWKAEIESGVVLSVLNTDVTGLYGTNYLVRPGVTVASAGEYNVIDCLVVGLGFTFTQRDYFYENTGSDSWNTRYNNNFLNIPLSVGYYLIHNPFRERGIWIKPQVGVYYEYFTAMHTKGSYPMNNMGDLSGEKPYIDFSSTYDFKANENHLRRNLFGGEAGIQAGYSFGQIDAFVGYRFQYGFSHIYQEKSLTGKTARRNSSVITLGAAYKF